MAYAFENMKAWQEARTLVVDIYRLSSLECLMAFVPHYSRDLKTVNRKL